MHDRAAAELPWPSPIPRRIHDAGKAGVRLKGRASRVTGDGGGRFERNELWGNSDCGVRVCEEAADSLLFDNLVRDHAGNGIYFESEAFDRFMTTDNDFERQEATVELGKAVADGFSAQVAAIGQIVEWVAHCPTDSLA